MLLFFGLISYISGYLTFITIAMIAFLFFTSGHLKDLETHFEIKNTEDSGLWSFLTNIFSGAKTLKSMVSESLILRRYEQLLNKI